MTPIKLKACLSAGRRSWRNCDRGSHRGGSLEVFRCLHVGSYACRGVEPPEPGGLAPSQCGPISEPCAFHVVSPRDLWLCVLPKWQFNVNVSRPISETGRRRQVFTSFEVLFLAPTCRGQDALCSLQTRRPRPKLYLTIEKVCKHDTCAIQQWLARNTHQQQ
jgi:hypothetical protein